ncbi:MAG: pyridoxal phosphate-dependent aminotransferase [Chloroflexi bacterium]|nr:pyridoxal phosphate-dependent aminotransferase [Chloroflexota bacterium]
MKYDFDRVIDRRGTCSAKWDGLLEAYGDEDVLPMPVADMDFRCPPAVIEALKKRAEHGIFGYANKPPSYFQAIVDWMLRRHGWQMEKDWLAHSPGVVPGLNLVVLALSHPGDKILVQSPVYYPFFNVIRNNGRQIVDSPLKVDDGRYAMDLEDLEGKFDPRVKMLILCSPNNPTGTVWATEDLIGVSEFCLRHHVTVVSDEIHSDLVYKGAKHTPTASLSPEFAQNTITFIAPSKTFNLPGLSTSVAIIPNPRLRDLYSNMLQNVGSGANVFGVVGLEAAYRYGEDWLEELLEYLGGNVDFLVSFVQERIPKVKVRRPQATYLMWLDCRGIGVDPASVQEFMVKRAKVGLNDGAAFGPGGVGFLRMNIACPRRVLEEGLRRIEEAVNSL